MRSHIPSHVFGSWAIVALAGLTLAACGSSGGASTASAQPPKNSSGEPATVGVASTALGNVLVNGKGRTLYLFKKDTGTTSTCTGSCATFWPPVAASTSPTVGRGADAVVDRGHEAAGRHIAADLQRPSRVPLQRRPTPG